MIKQGDRFQPNYRKTETLLEKPNLEQVHEPFSLLISSQIDSIR